MIYYTISMPQPHTHLYHVMLTVDGVSGPTLDVALPVWTPGSYMVRDYARHVQEFQAFPVSSVEGEASGEVLPFHKTNKTTWQIETGGAQRVTITYKVYAFDLTVRTSHLDGTHGYFNPATLCMYVPGRLNEPHGVTVEVPDGWRVTTGLSTDKGQRTKDESIVARSSFVLRQSSFVAEDYDELVDSPFECGTHRLLTFTVDDIPHEIAIWGHGNEDEARLLADTQRIVETQRDMFGGLPYSRYVFIVHLTDGRGGGLEHRNSVTNLFDRWTFQPQSAYDRYLALTSHEFFHVWDVKRIRPQPLGPFDYSRENYTRQLWTIEGVTSYYTDLLLVRAGLMSHERYMERLADRIVAQQSQPGRHVQSLRDSSFDAWIKYYRPDENTPNSAISYYLKGELVSLLLDLELRARTDDERSLDDVLRYLYKTYPADGSGFAENDGFRDAVEIIAGQGSAAWIDDFFARYIHGTTELDYERAFAHAGLTLRWEHKRAPEHGQPVTLGVHLKAEHGATKISVVLADGPAYSAGVYAHDELLALDGFRVDETRLNARLAERVPGDTVTISLFRGNELLHIPVTLAPALPDRLTIVPDEHASDEQRALYTGWLGANPMIANE